MKYFILSLIVNVHFLPCVTLDQVNVSTVNNGTSELQKKDQTPEAEEEPDVDSVPNTCLRGSGENADDFLKAMGLDKLTGANKQAIDGVKNDGVQLIDKFMDLILYSSHFNAMEAFENDARGSNPRATIMAYEATLEDPNLSSSTKAWVKEQIKQEKLKLGKIFYPVFHTVLMNLMKSMQHTEDYVFNTSKYKSKFPYRCYQEKYWKMLRQYLSISFYTFYQKVTEKPWHGLCGKPATYLQNGLDLHALVGRLHLAFELLAHHPNLGTMTRTVKSRAKSDILKGKIIAQVKKFVQSKKLEELRNTLYDFFDIKRDDTGEKLFETMCTPNADDTSGCEMVEIYNTLIQMYKYMGKTFTYEYCRKSAAVVNVLNAWAYIPLAMRPVWEDEDAAKANAYRDLFGDMFSKLKEKQIDEVEYLVKDSTLKERLVKDCSKRKEISIQDSRNLQCVVADLLMKLEDLVGTDATGQIKEDMLNGLILGMMITKTNEYIDYNLNDMTTFSEKILNRIFEMAKENKIGDLENFMKKLPSANLLAVNPVGRCTGIEISNHKKMMTCQFEDVINQVFVYVNAQKIRQNPSTIVIDMRQDYKELLKNYKMDALNEELKLQIMNIEHTLEQQTFEIESHFDGQLDDRFAGLEKYYTKLSDFDITKSIAAVTFIHGRLEGFYEKSTNLRKEVENHIANIVDTLIAGELIQVAEKAYALGVKTAAACNPFDPDPGDVLDAVDELAEATTEADKAVNVKNLLNKASKNSITMLKKFKGNRDFLEDVHVLVAKLAKKDIETDSKYLEKTQEMTEEEFENITLNYLAKYNAYDPGVQAQDMEEVATDLDTALTEACELINELESAGSRIAVAKVIADGSCTNGPGRLAKLMSLYSEMYEYQDQLMETLGDAVRGHLSQFYAQELHTNLRTDVSQQEAQQNNEWKKFISQSEAVNFFLNYRSVIFSVAYEYCNALKYRNGGLELKKCKRKLEKLTQQDLSDLISIGLGRPLGHERTATIPTCKKCEKGEYNGCIDMKQLLANEEVYFQIPNTKWLKDNNWIADDWVTGYGIFVDYIKPVLILPENPDIKFTVRATTPVYLNPEDTDDTKPKYALEPDVESVFTYNENSGCNSKSWNHLGKVLCQLSDDPTGAERNANIKPSVFSLWKIKMIYPTQVDVDGFIEKSGDSPFNVFVKTLAVSPEEIYKRKKLAKKLR